MKTDHDISTSTSSGGDFDSYMVPYILPVRWSAIWLPGLSAPWLATWIPVASFSECLCVIGIHTSGKRKIFAIIYLFCLKYATDQMRDRSLPTNRILLLKLCLLPKLNWQSESVWCSYGVQFILWPFPGTRLQFNVPWWLFNGFFVLSRIKGRCDLSGPWHDASYYQVRQICVKVSYCEGVEVKKNYWDCRYCYFFLSLLIKCQPNLKCL